MFLLGPIFNFLVMHRGTTRAYFLVKIDRWTRQVARDQLTPRIAMWVYNIEEEVDVNGKSVYGEKETLGEDLYHGTYTYRKIHL